LSMFLAHFNVLFHVLVFMTGLSGSIEGIRPNFHATWCQS
jgi:hypothetical protein